MSDTEAVAGYEGLLPVQQKWFDHLMAQNVCDWPPALQEAVQAACSKWGMCGEVIADAVGLWVKEQRD